MHRAARSGAVGLIVVLAASLGPAGAADAAATLPAPALAAQPRRPCPADFPVPEALRPGDEQLVIVCSDSRGRLYFENVTETSVLTVFGVEGQPELEPLALPPSIVPRPLRAEIIDRAHPAAPRSSTRDPVLLNPGHAAAASASPQAPFSPWVVDVKISLRQTFTTWTAGSVTDYVESTLKDLVKARQQKLQDAVLECATTMRASVDTVTSENPVDWLDTVRDYPQNCGSLYSEVKSAVAGPEATTVTDDIRRLADRARGKIVPLTAVVVRRGR